MKTSAIDFLGLAGREASRYGDDAMVFLRELLQNARDAGARRVSVETECRDGVESISVTDDGRGMDIDHAQRFLLTLYASSKSGSSAAAGRFGVGFWSILRFEPAEILIRSRVKGAVAGWEIVFNSDLELLSHRRSTMAVGTAVVLKRPARTDDLQALSWDRIRRDARHLRCRDRSDSLVQVTVNGRLATEPLTAARPGLSFRRSGLRGVISLGPDSYVTLLAHGLRVRSAATVDDLLLAPGRRRRDTGNLPASGLSPQVVVDCDRLAVLMDRGDVAQDRHLERVAQIIRSETRRLCEMELDRLAPRSLWRRIRDGVLSRRVRIGAGMLILATVALALFGALGFGNWWPRPSIQSALVREHSGFAPYVDRSELYGGPVTNSIDGTQSAPMLKYDPPDSNPYLAAFRINGIDEDGRPIRHQSTLRSVESSAGLPDESIKIEVRFQAIEPLLRLPVPTGHRVDSSSVLLDGHHVDLWLTADDEPAIRVAPGTQGGVAYRTFEGAAKGTAVGQWPTLQPSLKEVARELNALPPAQRIGRAIDRVQTSLSHTGSSDSHGSADSAPGGFVRSVFLAGGGDCDVVNTILAAVLTEAGLRSRLAVGWVGAGGVAVAGLHAWVEVDLGAGDWIAADATLPRSSDSVPQLGPAEETSEVSENPDFDAYNESEPDSKQSWFGALVVILLVLGVVATGHFRTKREYLANETLDSGPLVESLVRDREAWPGYSDARLRALIPGHRSGRYSLAEIEEAALESRLFVSTLAGESAFVAEQGGGLIIDGTTRAGRVAAAAFGAFDLNEWDTLWGRAATSWFDLEIQESIDRAGLCLQLRAAGDVPGGAMGFSLGGGARGWVVIDAKRRDWENCRTLIDTNREEAIFRAADIVLEALPGARRQGERVLAILARSVLNVIGRSCGENP